MPAPALTVRSIRAVGVEVPMRLPLGTSAATIRAAPLLLIDVETEEGVTGQSYVFCYVRAAAPAIASLLAEVLRVVKGDRVAPVELWAKLARRFTLIGVQGVVRMAMSGFDVACWDALAVAAGKPLVSILGGNPRPIPAYNSNGLGLMSPEAAADEAVKPTSHWLEYVDWADPVLAEPLRIVNGQAVAPDRPGSGIAWNEDAVERYRIG